MVKATVLREIPIGTSRYEAERIIQETQGWTIRNRPTDDDSSIRFQLGWYRRILPIDVYAMLTFDKDGYLFKVRIIRSPSFT